jgi:4,5-DOPA dioxygenase extradiol
MSLPVLFVSHGSPLVLLDDDDYTRALRRVGSTLAAPAAIVVVSAHWQTASPVRVTAAAQPEQLRDFDGFPAALYAVPYTPPGAPGLAADLVAHLQASGIAAGLDATRGLDHGAWVPLRFACPAADVPVIQVALPSAASPRALLELGAALAPLRDQGVWIVGSGGIVHNLRRVRFAARHAPADGWAREFDTWVWEQLEAGDLDALCDYERRAPHADQAVPTTEHFDPLFVALGASGRPWRVTSVHASFQHGNLSMRTLLLE